MADHFRRSNSFRREETRMKLARLVRASHLMAGAAFEKCIPLILLSLAVLVVAGVPAIAANDFYKGKTVKFIISDVAGGGYEAYGRMVARHIGKYLPGHPNVIPMNMPGADGIIAANHLFNIAERDGTVIAGLNRYVATIPLLGNANAKFK